MIIDNMKAVAQCEKCVKRAARNKSILVWMDLLRQEVLQVILLISSIHLEEEAELTWFAMWFCV